jgi:hypothetical protein
MPYGLYINIYTGFEGHFLTVNVDLLLLPFVVFGSVHIVLVIKIDRYTPTQSGAPPAVPMRIMIIRVA